MDHTDVVDHLYRVLDGYTITLGDRRWRFRLYGLRTTGGHRWIQLALLGVSTYMLTLRLSPAGDGAEAIAVLMAWLTNPDERHDAVLNVGRVHARGTAIAAGVPLT